MRISIPHVLLLLFISVIRSSSDEGYDEKLTQVRRESNWQTTYLNDPSQYYLSCTNLYTTAKNIFRIPRYFGIEFVEDCSIPNVSLAEIINTDIPHLLRYVNEIRFNSFSNSGIILQSYHLENLTSLRRLYIKGNITKIDELSDDIFEEISVLEELSLNNVGITVQLLEPLARKIVKLELVFNNLTTLNDNIFLNFSEMKFLSIKRNNFHNISKYVFNSTLKLIQLDLIGNNIEYLDNEVFGKLGSLKHLNLSHNSLTKLPNKLFASAVGLVKISIDANELEELPEDLFRNCKNITFISLKNNFLKNLPNRIFDWNYHLEELDISDNQLQELDGMMFHSTYEWSFELRKLRLARNHLKDLFNRKYPPGSLESLVELDVSHNGLNTVFPKNESPWNYILYRNYMWNVEVINFRNNSLDESRFWINPLWKKLRTVDLSYNQFNGISMEYFISRSNANTTFNFINNPIRNLEFNRVEERILQDCHDDSSCGTATIILEYNTIECNCNIFGWAKLIQGKSNQSVYNHLHYQSLDQPSCQRSNSKKKIPLIELNLQEITCPALEENGHLKIFYEKLVDFNFENSTGKCDYQYRPARDSTIVNCSKRAYNLQSLNQYDFIKKINKSVELILTNNNIVSLSDKISNLSWIPSLINLSLSSNSLKNVDELLIPNTLESLELDNNEISHLNDAVIGRINKSDKLTSITLHNNPWECSCKTEKMVRFFQDIRKKIMYPDNVVCNETGNSIFLVSTKYLCQGFLDKYWPFIIALILLALALTVTLIVHLCYIYKNEIKVWMFANKYLSWLVTEEEIDKNKQYDAFICFSSKDLCFVKNELLPELEKDNKHHPPLKLCVHYRDFIVGEYIPSQIDHFVKISRRTVILLSTNFLKSEWAKIEFRSAHLESLRENRLKVITILLEEINEEDLDDDLKKYVSLYTYLKWGEPMFWERLRFALPHPQPTVVSTDLPLVRI